MNATASQDAESAHDPKISDDQWLSEISHEVTQQLIGWMRSSMKRKPKIAAEIKAFRESFLAKP